MLYKDLLEVNKNFQYSVNIEYDLNNAEKIKEYIPTSDVCDVLKIYVGSVLGQSNNEKRATLLVGPYGKGKSFLILSLLQIICFENKNIDILLNKIKVVDFELYEMIKRLCESRKKLLPIIIDSNYFNIEQSFLLALNDSLKRENLDDIIPNTVYDVCLELIDEWEKDKNLYADTLVECLTKNNISLGALKKSLKNYDKDAYFKFEDLYNCVIRGLKFNPMINTDIVKTYADVNNKLKEKGFSGMFIVYDEFSKTLENNNEYLSHDLKLIQDFAELANRSSKEEQLHLCCITHKSLDLYNNVNGVNSSEDFEKVAGRFKEVRFNRSLDQNYRIISFTLNKKNKYNKFVDDYIKNNQWFYDLIKKNSFFDSEDEKLVFHDCFPINPISEYSMIRLSELIAQNERTMFTLISDNDEYSFKSFITKNGSGLYNVDYLYDYFSSLLQNERNNIRNIYLRTESAIRRTKSDIKKRILKVLSIIEILDDYSKMPPTTLMISLALQIDNVLIEANVKELINDGIIKESVNSSYLDFAYIGTKEINSDVEKCIDTKLSNVSISKIIEEINIDKYYIPRKYNAINKIIRYFNVVFMDEKDFLSLNSFELLFENYDGDGIVVKLINKTNSISTIKNHFDSMNENERVILMLPKKNTKTLCSESMYSYALNYIHYNNDYSESSKEQIDMMIQEKNKEINELIKQIYKENECTIISSSKENNINDILFDICANSYNMCPIVNNEMLNKNEISKTYTKARNEIIKRIINKETDYNDLSETGTEMMVYNSIYSNDSGLSKQSDEVVKHIKKELSATKKEKKSLENIINKLIKPPYGIRKGLLPLFLSIAISNMSDNVILYYNSIEIDLNPENLSKVCSNPSKYYLLVEKETIEQDKYLKKLSKSLGIEPTDSYYRNTRLCSDSLKKWAISLPMIIKETNEEDNYLELNNKLIELKDTLLRFDINPHELLMEILPSIFDDKYDEVVRFIDKELDIDKYIRNYEISLIGKIKNEYFDNYKGSLVNSMKQWSERNKIDFSKVVFEGCGKQIYKALVENNYDDISVINNISTIVLGYRVSDWTTNNGEKIAKAIESLIFDCKKKILTSTINKTNKQISPIGSALKNNIESILDEFSDSVSNEEKIQILSEMVNKYTGGE